MLNSSKKIKLFASAYLPVILWAGLIFFLSSNQVLPGFETSIIDFIFKKLAHVFVYAVLYILLIRAIAMTVSKKRALIQLLLPVLLVMLYALSDEFHQSFIPNRHATLRDIGFDMLGVLLVFLKKYKYI